MLNSVNCKEWVMDFDGPVLHGERMMGKSLDHPLQEWTFGQILSHSLHGLYSSKIKNMTFQVFPQTWSIHLVILHPPGYTEVAHFSSAYLPQAKLVPPCGHTGPWITQDIDFRK